MKRTVEPELLDALPPDDRRAIRARRDLQRVNAWMGHARVLSRALAGAFKGTPPRTIVELGAGDGTLLLRVAQAMAPRWGPLQVVLVDRQRLITPRTKEAFEALSWSVDSLEMDVFDWLGRPRAEPSGVIIASLFLHHFTENDLRRLLQQAANQTRLLVACEPRRRSLSLRAAGLLWFIGCGEVAVHDARISVRAGFLDHELSDLWPADDRWQLVERQAGTFTHCFMAHQAGTEDA
jgi:hypothetical protein